MVLKKMIFLLLVLLGGIVAPSHSMLKDPQNFRLGYQDVIEGSDYYVIHGKKSCFRSYKSIVCTPDECTEISLIDHSKGFIIAYYDKSSRRVATITSHGLDDLDENMLHAYAKSRLDILENYAPPFSYADVCYNACIIS